MHRWILWGFGLLLLLAVMWAWPEEPGTSALDRSTAVDRLDTGREVADRTAASRENLADPHDSIAARDTSSAQTERSLIIRGQLKGAEDGRPVASARVELLRFSESAEGRRYDSPPVVTLSETDGSFTAELSASGSFEVFIIGEHHLELGQRILTIDEDEALPPWELKASGSLLARVVLPGGRPAHGASVELLRQPFRPGSQRLGRVPRLIGEDPRPQPDRAPPADADGLVHLKWLPPGEYRALARAQHASDSHAADFRISARRATEIVFQLEAASRIRGDVVQGSVPDAHRAKAVSLHTEPESALWSESDGSTFERTTANRLGDAEREIPILEDRFDSGPIPAGRYRIHLDTVWQRLVLEPGEERTITLGPTEPLRRVDVRVVDDSGRPLSGIPVTARQVLPHLDDSRLHVDQVLGEWTTDEGGRFALLIASEATIQLEAAPPGFRPHVELLPSDTMDHEMVLSAAAVVRGQVVDEDGAPVAGILVAESPRRLDIAIAHYRKMSAKTDDDGFFELAVTPGWTVLSVRGDGSFLPFHYEVALEAGVTHECTLQLERGGFLAGLVRDFVAEQGGRVRAASTGGTPFSARVDEAGRFQIKGLPAGLVVYSYRTLDGQYFEAGEAMIVPGEITEVEIEIPAPLELSGQILDASGEGIGGCQVELQLGPTPRWTHSDASGAFRFELRERGELTLTAFAPRPSSVSLWMPKEVLAETVVFAPPDARQLEVILKAGPVVDLVELRGTVRRGDSAAPNMIVAFSSNLEVTETQNAEVATTTDELGAFRLSVPSSAGVLLVLSEPSGALPYRRSIDPLVASRSPIEISLPGGSLRGHVEGVLPDHRTRVTLRQHGDVDIFAGLALIDSTFTFTDLPPGTYDVWMTNEASVALMTDIEVAENEVVDIGDMKPSPLAWCLVRVRSPDGVVLPGARYAATPLGKGAWTGLLGGQNGEAEIQGVAGKYRLEVTCDGYEDTAVTIDLGHERRPPLEIVLTPR
ncbi:MAG: carboxypeptidase-like regulatory domain-containing protein [Planctomycetota bacterium]